MAYDEGLAQRIREALADRPGFSEKRMFGGLAFLLRGRMCVGVVGDELMVRVGPEAYSKLVREPHARQMDFTGRPMKGFVYVAVDGFESDEALGRWVARGESGVASVPVRSERRLLRFSGAVKRDPAVQAWLHGRPEHLRAIARPWFERMRECGDDVRELMHDGRPTACVGDAGFAYVDTFKAHVNVGFFRGSALPDALGLLKGTGKLGRHVKLQPGASLDPSLLEAVITEAYRDIRGCLREEERHSVPGHPKRSGGAVPSPKAAPRR